MTLALPKLSRAETRTLMRENADAVLFPVHRMALEFSFPPEALRQELEAGRLVAVLAGIERVPCVSGAAFMAWVRNPDSPGVLVNHVLVYLEGRKKQ